MGAGSRRTSPRRTSPRRTSPRRVGRPRKVSPKKKKQKPCDSDQIRNPGTGRCVLKRSPLGKKILEKMGAGRRKSPRRVASRRTSPRRSTTTKSDTIKTKKTLTNGDCLFSAVFRSLRDKNLLDKFNNCYQDFGNDETRFIKNLRFYLSTDNILLTQYKNMFINIINEINNSENYSLVFNTMLEDLGDVRDILKHYKKNKLFKNSNLTQFLEDVQKEIRKKGSYTGQFEVEAIKEMVIGCDIGIELSRNKKELIKKIKSMTETAINDHIFLLLRGEHWEYI